VTTADEYFRQMLHVNQESSVSKKHTIYVLNVLQKQTKKLLRCHVSQLSEHLLK